MKTKLVEAAQSLGIHPSHLLLHVAQLDSDLTFQDVWPEIDDSWVECVAATGGHRRVSARTPVQPPKPSPAKASLSPDAVHVLDKLSRQGKYGDVAVTWDALLNLTHVPKRDLEDVVTELRRFGLLDHDGTGRGTISLKPGRRKEIETLAQKPPGTLRG